MSSAKLRLPDEDVLLPRGPRQCSCRVEACCCCVPLGPGAITIAVLCFLEAIVAFFVQDWINLGLQGLLICFFLVTLCKPFNQEVRRCLFLAYALVLILNLCELIAFISVYLVYNDVIRDLCEEFEKDPPSDDRLVFETVDACTYNLRLVTIAGLVAGSLVYFPFKYHLMLVLRAFYKEKRDTVNMHIAQEEVDGQTARFAHDLARNHQL